MAGPNSTTDYSRAATRSQGPIASDANTQLVVLSTDSTVTASSAATAHASPQSFTEASSNPLQADLAGNLKVNVISGGSAPADIAPATQNITAQDVGSASATGANNQSIITGAPTAGSAATFALSSIETVCVLVTGTWTGTLTQEVSIDGGTTWSLHGGRQAGTSYTASSYTNNYSSSSSVAGATHFRLRATAAWTGTATVKVVESTNARILFAQGPIQIADATTPSQQAAVSASGAVKVDGSAVNQPVLNAQAARVTAAWTSGTAGNTALSQTVTNYGSVIVSFNGSSITGGVISFEVSDDSGTTWYAIQAARVGAFIAETTYTLTGTNQVWGVDIGGSTTFRVRLSTAITGAGTANIGITASTAIDPMPVVGVSGTVTDNVAQFGGSNVVTGTGVGGAGIPRVTISNDSSLAANQSVNVAQMNGATTLMGNGVSGTGSQRVNIASDNTAFSVNATPTPLATVTATTVSFTAALTAKVAVKASAGRIYYYHFYNPNGTAAFVQLFDIASASVTLGTTTPTRVVVVPGGGVIDTPFNIGQSYGTAITMGATTTATGATTVTTGVVATIDYM